MNDICFEIDNMQLTLKYCHEAENQVKENLYALREISQKLTQELSAFTEHGKRVVRDIQNQIPEVQAMLHAVDQKIADAQNQKQQELPPPAKPSAPSNATEEQRQEAESAHRSKVEKVEAQNAQIRAQNDRIDAYTARCHTAKERLESILTHLRHLEASARSETEQTVSAAQEACRRATEAAKQESGINTAMQLFCGIFTRVYEAAQALYMLKPSEIRGDSSINTLFRIRNTHAHIAPAESFPLFNQTPSPAPVVNIRAAVPDEELCVNDRDRMAFFASAAGASRVKMPSANLHRLGGKRFIAEMEALGYRIVPQNDGSTIDANGMIHWEK